MQLKGVGIASLLTYAVLLLLQIGIGSTLVGDSGNDHGTIRSIFGAAVTPHGLNKSRSLIETAKVTTGPGHARQAFKLLEDAVRDILKDPRKARSNNCDSEYSQYIVSAQVCGVIECCISDKRGQSQARSIGEDCALQQVVREAWADPRLQQEACKESPDNPECRFVRCCLRASRNDAMAAGRNCFFSMYSAGNSLQDRERARSATVTAAVLNGLTVLLLAGFLGS